MSFLSDVESAVNDVGQFVEKDLAPVAEDIVSVAETIEGTEVTTRTEDGRVVTTTSSPTPDGPRRQQTTGMNFNQLFANPLVLVGIALLAFNAMK